MSEHFLNSQSDTKMKANPNLSKNVKLAKFIDPKRVF